MNSTMNQTKTINKTMFLYSRDRPGKIRKYINTIEKWGEIVEITNVQLKDGCFHVTAKTTLYDSVYFIPEIWDYYRWSPFGECWSEHSLPDNISEEPLIPLPKYTSSKSRNGMRKDKKCGKIIDITVSDTYKWMCCIEITTEKTNKSDGTKHQTKSDGTKYHEPITIQIQNCYNGCNYWEIKSTFDLCSWDDIIDMYGAGKNAGNCTEDICRNCDNELTGHREKLRGLCRHCSANKKSNKKSGN